MFLLRPEQGDEPGPGAMNWLRPSVPRAAFCLGGESGFQTISHPSRLARACRYLLGRLTFTTWASSGNQRGDLMLKRLIPAAVVAISLAGLTFTSPASAESSAAGPKVWGPYYFKSAGNGQCLTSGNNVLYYDTCGAFEIQRFYVLQYPSSFVALKSKGTGKCVDVDGSSRIYVNTCNDSNYQGFIEREENQGYYSYRPVNSSSFCLAPGSAGRLSLKACTPSAQWKQWKTTPPK
ncbi:hypothetical protein [Nonomuraea sp. NPDC049758]|uniref:RICIN domain-containing protein n=1 Tax=Nonomuraea sp. NPDC049758 TaxID=3154360 RepID=UPI003434D4E5